VQLRWGCMAESVSVHHPHAVHTRPHNMRGMLHSASIHRPCQTACQAAVQLGVHHKPRYRGGTQGSTKPLPPIPFLAHSAA
jgi:hypothetical protein